MNSLTKALMVVQKLLQMHQSQVQCAKARWESLGQSNSVYHDLGGKAQSRRTHQKHESSGLWTGLAGCNFKGQTMICTIRPWSRHQPVRWSGEEVISYSCGITITSWGTQDHVGPKSGVWRRWGRKSFWNKDWRSPSVIIFSKWRLLHEDNFCMDDD